jgi:hypothetical protein
MPHGPANAVSVDAPVKPQGLAGSSFGGGGITIDAGCPESMRVMSGFGPSEVMMRGVWQSLQPVVVTKYLPRSTMFAAVAAGAGVDSALVFSAGGRASHPASSTTTIVARNEILAACRQANETVEGKPGVMNSSFRIESNGVRRVHSSFRECTTHNSGGQ